MSSIFATLFAVHPLAPLLFLVVFANGIAAPPIYFALHKETVNMSALWSRAKAGEAGAMYAVMSWAALLVASAVIFAVTLTVKPLN